MLSPKSLHFTPCGGAQVYHPDVELKLNDLVEVIGVYSLSPDLVMSFDGMDLAANTPGAITTADILAKHPPSSLVWHSTSSSSHACQCMLSTCLKPNALWLCGQKEGMIATGSLLSCRCRGYTVCV